MPLEASLDPDAEEGCVPSSVFYGVGPADPSIPRAALPVPRGSTPIPRLYDTVPDFLLERTVAYWRRV